MSNVTEHNDIDAFRSDDSNLTSLAAYLGENVGRTKRIPIRSR